MCGIVGMVGDERPCVNVLLDGLKRLEYRGYDSAGIATVNDGEFEIVRSAGKLRKLETRLGEQTMAGTLGIGHTRWATHGRPSEENAHPHRHEDVVVVHNGIIENYAAIKKDLGSKGHSFGSETDSEIIAHLVHLAYADSGDLLVAVQATLKQLTGSFAIGVLHVAHPDRMVVARRMSPLVLGLGERENYVASDVPALLNETRRFIFLEDDELALLTKSEVSIYSLEDLTPLERPVRNITWTPAMAEKGGYKHFMLKEIYEQPRAVTDTLRPRLALADGDVNLEELGELESRANEWDTIAIVACGTSYHAGLVGKYLIEELVRIPCTLEVASEFRYRNPLVNERQLLVAVSQSGETADTIAAVQEAQQRGASVLTICNVVDSTLARMSDAPIYTFAGPEIGVASTKAFTAQLAAFALLTIWLGRRRGAIDADAGRLLLEDLIHLPILMEEALKEDKHIQQVARKFIRTNSMLYLGRGLGFPIALEGALKLKELSYIHAEGYPAGEMKHGPIALVDDETPSLFIVPEGASFEKTVSNMEEIKSRGGPIIAVTTKGQDRINDLAQDIFLIPPCNAFLESFLTVLPLQLFAYHVADLKGTDVDQPRNLAKSVTVE
jgi:glutamine---fructose-6-phosphate transaminase (isomerizing)